MPSPSFQSRQIIQSRQFRKSSNNEKNVSHHGQEKTILSPQAHQQEIISSFVESIIRKCHMDYMTRHQNQEPISCCTQKADSLTLMRGPSGGKVTSSHQGIHTAKVADSNDASLLLPSSREHHAIKVTKQSQQKPIPLPSHPEVHFPLGRHVRKNRDALMGGVGNLGSHHDDDATADADTTGNGSSPHQIPVGDDDEGQQVNGMHSIRRGQDEPEQLNNAAEQNGAVTSAHDQRGDIIDRENDPSADSLSSTPQHEEREENHHSTDTVSHNSDTQDIHKHKLNLPPPLTNAEFFHEYTVDETDYLESLFYEDPSLVDLTDILLMERIMEQYWTMDLDLVLKELEHEHPLMLPYYLDHLLDKLETSRNIERIQQIWSLYTFLSYKLDHSNLDTLLHEFERIEALSFRIDEDEGSPHSPSDNIQEEGFSLICSALEMSRDALSKRLITLPSVLHGRLSHLAQEYPSIRRLLDSIPREKKSHLGSHSNAPSNIDPLPWFLPCTNKERSGLKPCVHPKFSPHDPCISVGESVGELCFSPDNDYLFSCGGVLSGRPSITRIELPDEGVTKMQDHTSSVLSVCISADGKYLVSGAMDKTCRVWNVQTGKQVRRIGKFTDWVRCVRLTTPKQATSSPKMSLPSELLITASGNKIELWNFKTGQHENMLIGHSEDVMHISVNGKHCVSFSRYSDKSIRFWNLNSGAQVSCIQSLSPVTHAHLSANSKHIFTCQLRTIKVYDSFSGELLHILQGHTDAVTCAISDHDATHIFSSSWDNTIIVWDLKTGEALHRFYGHTDFVESLCLSHNGSLLASGSRDETIRIWNVSEASRYKKKSNPHDSKIASVSIVPSSTGEDSEQNLSVVSVGSREDDAKICFWNMDTGRFEKEVELEGLDSSYNCSLKVFTHGNSILSANKDKLFVHNVENGHLMFSAHSNVDRGDHCDNVGTVLLYTQDRNRLVYLAASSLPIVSINVHSRLVEQGFTSPGENVKALALTPNHDRLISGNSEGMISVWDLNSPHQCIYSFEAHNSGSVDALEMAMGSNRYFLSACNQEEHTTIKLWERGSRDASLVRQWNLPEREQVLSIKNIHQSSLFAVLTRQTVFVYCYNSRLEDTAPLTTFTPDNNSTINTTMSVSFQASTNNSDCRVVVGRDDGSLVFLTLVGCGSYIQQCNADDLSWEFFQQAEIDGDSSSFALDSFSTPVKGRGNALQSETVNISPIEKTIPDASNNGVLSPHLSILPESPANHSPKGSRLPFTIHPVQEHQDPMKQFNKLVAQMRERILLGNFAPSDWEKLKQLTTFTPKHPEYMDQQEDFVSASLVDQTNGATGDAVHGETGDVLTWDEQSRAYVHATIKSNTRDSGTQTHFTSLFQPDEFDAPKRGGEDASDRLVQQDIRSRQADFFDDSDDEKSSKIPFQRRSIKFTESKKDGSSRRTIDHERKNVQGGEEPTKEEWDEEFGHQVDKFQVQDLEARSE